MVTHTLLQIAIMIFAGMLCGRLVKQVKLPNVTGYLIAGLLLGPSVFNIIPETAIHSFTIISNAALGFIAFSIGTEFKISYFKRVGSTPIVIAVFESLFAVIAVVIGLVAAGFDLPFSLVLGAIAAATAPAATIMVIKQYKAKGPMTETLLSVVAIDDATALMYFGICVAIANALAGGDMTLGEALLSPLIEIGGALVVGFLTGIVFTMPSFSLVLVFPSSAVFPLCCIAWLWALPLPISAAKLPRSCILPTDLHLRYLCSSLLVPVPNCSFPFCQALVWPV